MKRIFLVIIAAIFGAVMLAGCGGEASGPASLSSGEASAGTPPAENWATLYAGEGAEYYLDPELTSSAGTLPLGEAVDAAGPDGGLYKIKLTDGDFYMKETDLTLEPAKTIAAWGTAILTAGAEQIPTSPGLSGSTVRQQVRTSFGGDGFALVLSNEYGDSPLEIEKIAAALIRDPKKPEVDLETEVKITLGGEESFTIPAGERVTTDPVDLPFEAFTDIAVTMKLGSAPKVISCHTASRCSAWVTEGDHVSDNDYTKFQEMTAWYFLAELDTLAPADSGVVICLGDSLTDGASVTTNGFSTYPQELARQVQADGSLDSLSVINMGIGATALYIYGGEIAGTNRANRDVLKVPGVKYCVLLMGVNDIGAAQSDISQNIINEYKSLIERCHENGIKLYGCTLTPFKGNSYYSELHEKIRKAVNEFVLSEDSGFDGVIDLAAEMADPNDPEKMKREYVSVWNDWLHFNDGGYKHIGETVYSHLKDFIENTEE